MLERAADDMKASIHDDGRATVYQYFERGVRTRHLPPLAQPRTAYDTLRVGDIWARFTFQTQNELLVAVRFDCVGCTTLIACCQALAELVVGKTPSQVYAMGYWSLVRSLLQVLSGIPIARHDRARLAVSALRTALRADGDHRPHASRTKHT